MVLWIHPLSASWREIDSPFLKISRDRTGSAAVSEIISAEDMAVTVVAARINAPMVTTSSMSLSVSSPFGEGWCDSASAANEDTAAVVSFTVCWSLGDGCRLVASAAAFVLPGRYATSKHHGSVRCFNRNRHGFDIWQGPCPTVFGLVACS